MLADALIFVLNTLFGLFTVCVLLRFYMQLVGAPFHNPVAQAIVAFTNFLVRPTRRVIPALLGLDMATLLLAFIAQLILQLATLWLQGYPLLLASGTAYTAMIGLVFMALVRLSIYIFLYAVLIQAILSWVNPYTPVAPLLDSLTRPLLQPLQRRFGTMGGLDLTPLIVFLVAQLLLMLVVAPVEMQLQHLL